MWLISELLDVIQRVDNIHSKYSEYVETRRDLRIDKNQIDSSKHFQYRILGVQCTQ